MSPGPVLLALVAIMAVGLGGVALVRQGGPDGGEDGLPRTYAGRPMLPINPSTAATEPVKVQIGDLRLAIPRRYLDAPIEKDDQAETFLTEDGFYRTTGVFMITELPDLTPRTPESLKEWRKTFTWKTGRWMNVLLLLNRKIGNAGPSDAMFKTYSRMRESMDEFERKGTLHGLEWLSHPSGIDSFVKHEGGERTVFISCRVAQDQSLDYCQHFIAPRPTLHVKITYGGQYLPRWQEIETKVRARIEAFIAAAEAGG
jgi:hypothetical protein